MWPADAAFDTQRRLEWTRRILETEQVYSVRGARLNRGAWRCSARSRSTGRGNLKATEGAEAHGAHPKRARVKHDPWTGHLRPAIGEVQVAAHASLMHLVAHMIQQDSRRILSTSGCQCPLGPFRLAAADQGMQLEERRATPGGRPLGRTGMQEPCAYSRWD